MDNKLQADAKLTKVGVVAPIWKKTFGVYPADFQLMTRRFFRVHRNTPWMKDMLKRVKEERSQSRITFGNVMAIFPAWSVQCTKYFLHK